MLAAAGTLPRKMRFPLQSTLGLALATSRSTRTSTPLLATWATLGSPMMDLLFCVTVLLLALTVALLARARHLHGRSAKQCLAPNCAKRQLDSWPSAPITDLAGAPGTSPSLSCDDHTCSDVGFISFARAAERVAVSDVIARSSHLQNKKTELDVVAVLASKLDCSIMITACHAGDAPATTMHRLRARAWPLRRVCDGGR